MIAENWMCRAEGEFALQPRNAGGMPRHGITRRESPPVRPMFGIRRLKRRGCVPARQERD